MKLRLITACSIVVLLAVLFTPFAGSAGLPEPAPEPLPSAFQSEAAAYGGTTPLLFMENRGQLDPQVAFRLTGGATSVYFGASGITYALVEPAESDPAPDPLRMVRAVDPNETARPGRRWAVKLDFVGARPEVRPVGEDPAETTVSYFRGRPETWLTGLHTFRRVVYRDLWPGIDLAYFSSEEGLKYEFTVHPGADPGQIRLAYRGADIMVNAKGQVEVKTPLGRLTDDAPVVWQQDDARPLPASFKQLGSEIRFQVGDYDETQTLVIDPLMFLYAGYVGGYRRDEGAAIAVGPNGEAYITGRTESAEDSFPLVAGPDLTYNGADFDAFVGKLNPAGTEFVYLGYIGGNDSDAGTGIAVDASGAAYVGGYTWSTEKSFPVTVGPDLTNGGVLDGFIAKVDPTGTKLVYCGYLGGASYDAVNAVAVDAAGSAYLAGDVSSDQTTMTVLVGPDLTYNGGGDAIVAKVNPAGTAYVYAGYIGGSSGPYGSGGDHPTAIAVDRAGNAYITGSTVSDENSFPVLVGPDLTFNITPNCSGCMDTFVAKVNASGASLAYCGFLGRWTEGRGIAVDSVGNAYVAGWGNGMYGESFPAVVGPDLTMNGDVDAYVAKIDPTGANLLYAGYIGGDKSDGASAIAIDSAGSAYVTGWVMSSEDTFPTLGGLDGTFGGVFDGFIAKWRPRVRAWSMPGISAARNRTRATGLRLMAQAPRTSPA